MNYICIEYYYSFKNMIKVTSDARKSIQIDGGRGFQSKPSFC